MPVTGDFAELRELKRKLKEIANEKLQAEVSRQVAHETLTLIADGFRAERDPYGDAWRGLKVRSGRILQDTGRLRNSFTIRDVSAEGFRVGSAVKYGAFHQRGNARLPRRMMVPLPRKLPEAWARAWNETIGDVVAAHFDG